MNPAGFSSLPLISTEKSDLAHEGTELLYAVPVTCRSFLRAYTIHRFWAPRNWQLWRYRWTAFRISIYTVQTCERSGRKIVCRLPVEILALIEKELRWLALELAENDITVRTGTLSLSANQTVKTFFGTLEKLNELQWHRNKVDRDPVAQCMVEKYGITILPGFVLAPRGRISFMAHIFLCVSKEPGKQVETRGCEPLKYIHPALSPEKQELAPTTKRFVYRQDNAIYNSREPGEVVLHILGRKFVLSAFDGNGAIDQLVRDWELEVIALSKTENDRRFGIS